MNKWVNDQMLSMLDKEKADLIKEVISQTQGKNNKAVLPVLTKLVSDAKKKNISFTPSEIELIFELMKMHKTEKEKKQIDRMIQMVQNIVNK